MVLLRLFSLSLLSPLSVYSVSFILALERTVVPEEELIVSFKSLFDIQSINVGLIMKNLMVSFKIVVFNYSDNQCIMKSVIVSFVL